MFKKLSLVIALIFSFLMVIGASKSASEIMEAVDKIAGGASDQKMTMKLMLTDKNGDTKEREILMYQKGNEMRVGKFLSPNDQKGIGFLSMPGGVIHIYLPAYKKIKNIASHVKNSAFAGTDFTYEDMEVQSFSKNYTSVLESETDTSYLVAITPKKDFKTGYSKLIMLIDKNLSMPLKIDYYEKDKITKTMIREDITKVGDYYISKKMTMTTLKNNHKTAMIILNVEFDTKISDDYFTDRYLKE